MAVMNTLRKGLPWLLAALIAIWTLGPLELRPHTGHAQAERFGAYFVFASAMTWAYPKQWIKAALGIAAGAVVLELLQWVVPGRDPGLPDALSKVAGALDGPLITTAALAAFSSRPSEAPV